MKRIDLFKKVKRIVVKIGSSSITDNDKLSTEKILKFANDISNIKKNGTIFFREVLPMQSILSILPMLSVTYVVT